MGPRDRVEKTSREDNRLVSTIGALVLNKLVRRAAPHSVVREHARAEHRPILGMVEQRNNRARSRNPF